MKVYIFLCLAAFLIGCASTARQPGPLEVPETLESQAATPQSSTQPQGSLQKLPSRLTFSGDPEQNRSLREVETVLRSMPLQRLSSESISVGEIFVAAKRHQRVNSVMATNGNLEHLKAIVAAEFSPLLIVRASSGGKHVWALTSFDDESQMLTLANPLQRSQIRQSYADFVKSWESADSRRGFLLISAQALTASSVKFELGKYLPPDQVAKLNLTD